MLKSGVYSSKSSVGAFKSHWWYPLASVECAGSVFGTVSPRGKYSLDHILLLHFCEKKESKWLKPRFALKHRPKVGLFERIGWL
jgi:hypothetical protein